MDWPGTRHSADNAFHFLLPTIKLIEEQTRLELAFSDRCYHFFPGHQMD